MNHCIVMLKSDNQDKGNINSKRNRLINTNCLFCISVYFTRSSDTYVVFTVSFQFGKETLVRLGTTQLNIDLVFGLNLNV